MPAYTPVVSTRHDVRAPRFPQCSAHHHHHHDLPHMNPTILDKAAAVIPDQRLLVNVVRLRVRQLSAGHRPLIEVPPGMGLSDVALSEIAQRKLTSEPNVAALDAVTAAPIITFPAAPVGKKKAA